MNRDQRRQDEVAELGDYESGPDATQRATATALRLADRADSVILVEGTSDQIAVDAVLARSGLDVKKHVAVPIGGAQAAAQFVGRFEGRRVLGLCDAAERRFYVDAFVEQRLDPDAVFVCEPDLEGELIACFEPDELEAIIEAQGDLGSFTTMRKQPAWRDRPFADQAHRWIRARSRRSSLYARILVDAADEHRLPTPLLSLVGATSGIGPQVGGRFGAVARELGDWR